MDAQFFNSDLKYSPNSNERPGKSSSIMTSIAAIETAHASGFPPNVEPCEPGVNTSNTSLSARTTEIGNTLHLTLFLKYKHPVLHNPNPLQIIFLNVLILLEFHQQ